MLWSLRSVALCWLAASVSQAAPAGPRPGVQSGQPAPPLALIRLDEPGPWQLHARLDPTGGACPQGFLVAFLASWCGPCAASLPTLVELERAHPELEVVVVVVDTSPAGQAQELSKVQAAGLSGPVLAADPAALAAWTGGSASVPRFVFVDRWGQVVAQDHGFGDEVRPMMPSQARRALAP